MAGVAEDKQAHEGSQQLLLDKNDKSSMRG